MAPATATTTAPALRDAATRILTLHGASLPTWHPSAGASTRDLRACVAGTQPPSGGAAIAPHCLRRDSRVPPTTPC
jgi:hypothetical protein